MKYFLPFLFFILCGGASATVDLGVGLTSLTSGRQIPALAAALKIDDWTISALSAGTATPLYSHSGYYLGVTRDYVDGEFLGKLTSSVGLGAYYARRAYRATETSITETRDDHSVGPAFKVSWRFIENAYLGFDFLMGIRLSTAILALAVQDVVGFSMGVSF